MKGPNAQLREHLTDAELDALHDVLADPTASLARPLGAAAATAGGLAAAGTAAAEPSTTDSDPDVGLPSDRFDLWADGIDANSVRTGRYHDGVNDLGTIVGGVEIDPNGGNVVLATLDGGMDLSVGTLDGPRDGMTLRVKFDRTNSAITLNWSGVEWDGGTAPKGFLPSGEQLLSLRTYDGGATWHGRWDNIA